MCNMPLFSRIIVGRRELVWGATLQDITVLLRNIQVTDIMD